MLALRKRNNVDVGIESTAILNGIPEADLLEPDNEQFIRGARRRIEIVFHSSRKLDKLLRDCCDARADQITCYRGDVDAINLDRTACYIQQTYNGEEQ